MGNNRPGVGIIGLGGFGYFLLREWSKLDEIRVVAASDENPARVPAAAGELHFYQNYRDMLDDPNVQIVSIATPPSTHVPMALAAIEKGKHVIIEKPLALSADDGRKIAEAAKGAGVVATVNFMLRFNPLVEGMRKIIASGVFGQPRRVELRNFATQETLTPGHLFRNHDAAGGILIEHGVHFFDMSSWMLDSCAKKATGLSVWRNKEQEDRMFAAVEFENDVIGTYWHSFSRPVVLETTSFHMAFDLGEVEIKGWIPLSASFFGWTDKAGVAALRENLPGLELNVEELSPLCTESSDQTYSVTASVRGTAQVEQPKIEVYGNLVRAMMMDVVAAIRDPKHRLRVSLEDGIAAVAVAEQATKAAHSDSMLPVE
jgi:predicted dehydrogenase